MGKQAVAWRGTIAALGGLRRWWLGAAASTAVTLNCAYAADAPRERVETVTFSDPRWPAVKVVRGIPPAGRTRPVPIAGVPAAARVPGTAPLRVAAATTVIVTFGDGRGERVTVVRGTAPAPASSTAPVRPPPLGVPPVAVLRGGEPFGGGLALFGAANGGELDRVAFAVDGAESGHGSNPAMWRPEPAGPQGPMQVSAAAALDVGGGDRFDLHENRLLGRAYLAKLYGRYGNWPDAVAAYNWGPGNLDQWIGNGRPADALPLETARYLLRVLRDRAAARAVLIQSGIRSYPITLVTPAKAGVQGSDDERLIAGFRPSPE